MWQFERSFDELMEEVVAIAVADVSYQFLQGSAQSGRYKEIIKELAESNPYVECTCRVL
jgi:hypothetical protein